MYKSAFHKLFILLIIIILPVFILKRHHLLRDRSAQIPTIKTEKLTIKEEQHIVLIIPVSRPYNSLEKTLTHILNQTYTNYKIIFIDLDHNSQIQSNIETIYSKTRHDLTKKGQQIFPFFSIHRSYYDTIHSLENNDLVIHFESNDWFVNPKALRKIVNLFTNSKIWLAYSPYIEYPSFKPQLQHLNPNQKWWKLYERKKEWLMSPMKIFYAGLFKQVKFELSNPHKLKPKLELNIFLLPMVEKAKKHILYIKEALYYHSNYTEYPHKTFVYDLNF